MDNIGVYDDTLTIFPLFEIFKVSADSLWRHNRARKVSSNRACCMVSWIASSSSNYSVEDAWWRANLNSRKWDWKLENCILSPRRQGGGAIKHFPSDPMQVQAIYEKPMWNKRLLLSQEWPEMYASMW